MKHLLSILILLGCMSVASAENIGDSCIDKNQVDDFMNQEPMLIAIDMITSSTMCEISGHNELCLAINQYENNYASIDIDAFSSYADKLNNNYYYFSMISELWTYPENDYEVSQNYFGIFPSLESCKFYEQKVSNALGTQIYIKSCRKNC